MNKVNFLLLQLVLQRKIMLSCLIYMKKIKTLIGEDITPRELQKKALSGGKNKYRDAWLKVNGEALLNHARAMRAAVDEVDPDIRIGICSCISGAGANTRSHQISGRRLSDS